MVADRTVSHPAGNPSYYNQVCKSSDIPWLDTLKVRYANAYACAITTVLSSAYNDASTATGMNVNNSTVTAEVRADNFLYRELLKSSMRASSFLLTSSSSSSWRSIAIHTSHDAREEKIDCFCKCPQFQNLLAAICFTSPNVQRLSSIVFIRSSSASFAAMNQQQKTLWLAPECSTPHTALPEILQKRFALFMQN